MHHFLTACACVTLSCHASVCSWHPMIEHNLLVCMLCSCKKGMMDVKSLSKKCREVAISLLNTTCFHCCTVLQQAKAFPCKRGILYNTYSGCLDSILQLQRIQIMFSASSPNLVMFGVRNYLLQTCIQLWNIFRGPRRRNDSCCTETSFA